MSAPRMRYVCFDVRGANGITPSNPLTYCLLLRFDSF